LSDLGVDVI